jgi:hypothetical protein
MHIADWRTIMEQPVFSDASQFPTEEAVFYEIGKAKALWTALFEHVHSDHPDFTEQWKYYRDGKSWLLKVTRKKQTIFWLSVIKNGFRTTFYFTDKAEEILMSSGISVELKQKFRNGKHFNKIRGLTILHSKKKHVEDAKLLIGIKLLLK